DRLDAGAALNSLGFERDVRVCEAVTKPERLLRVPGFGYASGASGGAKPARSSVRLSRGTARLRRAGVEVTIDARRGVVTQLKTPDFPDGVLARGVAFGDLARMVGG